MPWGAVAGIVGTAASSAISSALAPSPNIPGSQLTGQSGPASLPSFNFLSPGANVSKNGAIGLTNVNSAGADPFLTDLTGATNNTNSALTDLLGKVSPAFGDLVNARVQSIRNARSSAISDLQGNLARRRILGSSFGQDAVTRTALDFANQEADQRAQGILESISATSQLLQQRLTNTSSLVDRELKQANFASTTAVNLLNGTQQTFSDNANALAALAAANSAGVGKAVSDSGISKAVTSAINNLIGSGGGTAPIGLGAGGAVAPIGDLGLGGSLVI